MQKTNLFNETVDENVSTALYGHYSIAKNDNASVAISKQAHNDNSYANSYAKIINLLKTSRENYHNINDRGDFEKDTRKAWSEA